MAEFNQEIILDNGKKIGADNPCFIVAELSANHNGSYDRAVSIIKAAARAGADAIKLQTYTADSLTINCDKSDFRIQSHNHWNGRLLYTLYDEAHTPRTWHRDLFNIAADLGLIIFSTPFARADVDFLEDLSCPIYKIASFEMVDHDFIEYVSQMGKPVIMSTGMGTLEEISEAVQVVRKSRNLNLALLKCISAYPSPIAEMNIRTITSLRQRFSMPIGLSDHCLDNIAAVTAVALGAKVIEKHITLNRSDGGLDSTFSIEPDEFSSLVHDIRSVEAALGEDIPGPGITESRNSSFRRSIYAITGITVGDVFSRENVRIIRPGYGLPPKYLKSLLGSKAQKTIDKGTPILPDCVENGILSA